MEFEFLPDIYDMVQLLIVTFFGWILVMRLAHFLQVERNICQLIYVWHFFFGVLFYLYTLNFVSDATSYYQSSYYMDEYKIQLGTNLVYIFYNLLISSLSLSYLAISLLMSILGSLGLLFLYATLREVSKYDNLSKKMILLIVLLPSLSFWSAGIGKDVLIFLFINMLLWASSKPKKRVLIMIISLVLIFLIRPHIAAPFFLLLLLTLYVNNNFKARIKNSISVILLLFTSAIVLFGLNSIGLSFDSIGSYIDSRAYYTALGSNSSFNLKDSNFFLIFINFVYFPILADQISIKHIPLILEGGIMFIISIIIILRGNFSIGYYSIYFLSIVIIFLVLVTALSLTLSNYGLLFRQKIMILPLLFYILFSIPRKGMEKF
jgi:hypothetical protein